MVSAQSPQACGTLDVGWALNEPNRPLVAPLVAKVYRISNSVSAQLIVFLQLFSWEELCRELCITKCYQPYRAVRNNLTTTQ